MENIILIIIISLLFLRTRTTRDDRSGYLGCGLVGFVPFKKRKANLDWIKLLLSYNATRGTDSCGIFINEGIRKGTQSNSDVRNWMANNRLEYEEGCKNRAIIGHCRRNSYGSENPANAHPFVFESEGRSIILAHNGMIENSWSMCEKHKVGHADLIIDSQMLAKLIVEKGYGVLDEYKGHAALIWAYSDDPGALYIFKGASRTNAYQNFLDDERPLFVIQNTDGTYISSMKEPLDACTNRDIVVYEPGQNQVVRVFNNEMDIVYSADRDDINVVYVPTHSHRRHSTGTANQDSEFDYSQLYKNENDMGDDGDDDVKTTTDVRNKMLEMMLLNEPKKLLTSSASSSLTSFRRISKPEDFYKELTYSSTKSYLKDVMYFIGGRYYCFTSSPKNTYIRNYHDVDEEEHISADMQVDKWLIHGLKFVKFGGSSMLWEVKKDNVSQEEFSSDKVFKRYFYRGIMIEPDRVSEFIKKDHVNRYDRMVNKLQRMRELSAYSIFPITMSYEEVEKFGPKLKDPDDAYIWYSGGHEIKKPASFMPMFGFRTYLINKSGLIVAIKTDRTPDRILDDSFDAYSTAPGVEFEEVKEVEGKTSDLTDDYVDLYVICSEGRDRTISRWKKKNVDAEASVLFGEQFDGIGDAQYFIRYEKTKELPEDVENITIEGEEVLQDAMEVFVGDQLPSFGDASEAQARRLITLGQKTGGGVVRYMSETHRFNIIGPITVILSEFIENTVEEIIEPEVEEMMRIEEDKVSGPGFYQTLGRNLFDNSNRMASFKEKGKEIKDLDALSEDEWKELGPKDWNDLNNKHKHGNRGD